MKVIERLRPEAQPMDAEWSAATLEGIFAAQPSSALTSRGGSGRGFALVGAATAAALGLGGVAYAAGIVPASVTEFFTDTSAAAVSDVHEVATFKTSDNRVVRTFVIWRGTDANGLSCTAVLEAGSKGGPDFGGNCGDHPTDAWFNTTNESYAGTIRVAPPPSTYYVYGEPTVEGVTEVRIVGAGFEHTVPIDASTGGYAVAIPEVTRGVSGEFAIVEFLDASGAVVGTRTLSEK